MASDERRSRLARASSAASCASAASSATRESRVYPQEEDEDHHRTSRGSQFSAIRSFSQDLLAAEIRESGHPFLDSFYFQTASFMLVILTTIELGIETDWPEEEDLWLGVSIILTAGFLTEISVRMYCLGYNYFQDRMNWFDLVLLIAALADVAITLWSHFSTKNQEWTGSRSLAVFRIVRLLRVMRLLRIFRVFDQLRVIVNELLNAMKTTFWVGLMMLTCIYACAILCTRQVGQAGEDYPGWRKGGNDKYTGSKEETIEYFDPEVYFGSMFSSMLTLFNIAVLDEWSDVIRPIALVQPWLVPPFIGFVLFVTFGVMNVIVAMMVENVNRMSQEMNNEKKAKKVQRKEQLLDEIRGMVFDWDDNNDGQISAKEIHDHIGDGDGHVRSLLAKLNLPHACTAQELLHIFNRSGDGVLKSDELLCSFYRLLHNDDFQHRCMVQMGVNELKFLMQPLSKLMKIVPTQSLQLEALKTSVQHVAQSTTRQLKHVDDTLNIVLERLRSDTTHAAAHGAPQLEEEGQANRLRQSPDVDNRLPFPLDTAFEAKEPWNQGVDALLHKTLTSLELDMENLGRSVSEDRSQPLDVEKLATSLADRLASMPLFNTARHFPKPPSIASSCDVPGDFDDAPHRMPQQKRPVIGEALLYSNGESPRAIPPRAMVDIDGNGVGTYSNASDVHKGMADVGEIGHIELLPILGKVRLDTEERIGRLVRESVAQCLVTTFDEVRTPMEDTVHALVMEAVTESLTCAQTCLAKVVLPPPAPAPSEQVALQMRPETVQNGASKPASSEQVTLQTRPETVPVRNAASKPAPSEQVVPQMRPETVQLQNGASKPASTEQVALQTRQETVPVRNDRIQKVTPKVSTQGAPSRLADNPSVGQSSSSAGESNSSTGQRTWSLRRHFIKPSTSTSV